MFAHVSSKLHPHQPPEQRVGSQACARVSDLLGHVLEEEGEEVASIDPSQAAHREASA